jgi:heme-degrading monooxygenase HmoA
VAGKAMFLIRVQPGKEEEFIAHWQKELPVLKSHKGFRARELIRVVEGEGAFVVLSEWDAPDDYHAWRQSVERARIYGADLAPLFAGPPVTGIGEVLLRME